MSRDEGKTASMAMHILHERHMQKKYNKMMDFIAREYTQEVWAKSYMRSCESVVKRCQAMSIESTAKELEEWDRNGNKWIVLLPKHYDLIVTVLKWKLSSEIPKSASDGKS